MYREKPRGWLKHIDFILIDVLCLQLAFVFAYISRYGLGNPYGKRLYLSIILVYSLVDITVIIYNNSLKNVIKRGYFIEFVQTTKHVMLVELLISFYLFLAQEGATYSRIVIFLIAIYYIVISYVGRVLWKKFLLSEKIKTDLPALYIITTKDSAENIITTFTKSHAERYRIAGICITDEDAVGQYVGNIPVTANLQDVLEFLCKEWIDEVYIALPVEDHNREKLVDGLSQMGIVVHMEMQYATQPQWQNQKIEIMAERTVMTIGMKFVTPRQMFFKRVFDILLGFIGSVITIVLTIIIGPLIFIQSPGPIFFVQTRIGKNGKKFKMYKFRSMHLDAEERKAELIKENRIKDGMMFKLDYDPRIIGCKKLANGKIKKGIGNFIRDFSLDEFPQFFNVLIGQMSICGTRPPTEDEWVKYAYHHRARLAIKPGITGLWQVSGRSNITDFEEVVELDTKYIREWSMGLDFRILFQTIAAVVGKKGSM